VIVNDDIITLRDAEKFVQVVKQGQLLSVNEYERNLKLKQKVDALIDDVLIRQQAKKLKVEVADQELAGFIENIKKQYSINDEQLKEQLKREGVSYREFTEGVKTSILRNRVLARVISPEVTVTASDLKAYYDKHREDYVEQEFRLQQILVSAERGGDVAQERAMKAYALLNEGRPFEEVAREFSDDPSVGLHGGDTGFVKKEELIPPLRAAVGNLIPGAYTPIIGTPYGLIIVKLLEVNKGAAISFEEAKTGIHERIVQEEADKRYKDYISKLRKSSYIEVKL